MYIEEVLDLWVQLMKNGGKNKSVAFIILFSVFYFCCQIIIQYVSMNNTFLAVVHVCMNKSKYQLIYIALLCTFYT